MKAIVKSEDLIAAIQFASKDMARPILTGVHIEVKDGIAKVIATDSYRLVVLESQSCDNIDGEVTLDMSELKPKKKDVYVIEHGEDDREATMTNLGKMKVTTRIIEGNYPNWKQLIPEPNAEAVPTTSFGISPNYAYELGKAYRAWKGNTKAPIYLEFQGSMKPAYMFDIEEKRSFTALIMPVKGVAHLSQPTIGNENTAKLESKLKSANDKLARAEKRIAELEANQNDPDTDMSERLDEASKTIEKLSAKLEELATTPKDDTQSKIDELIAKHELIQVAGSTSCAVYFKPTIEKDSSEVAAIKAAGGRYGNHKKFGKCWYMPKA